MEKSTEAPAAIPVPETAKTLLAKLGQNMMRFAEYVGGLALLSYKVGTLVIRGKLPFSLTIEQIYLLGIKTLPLTSLVAIFTGMVLALQFIVGLQRFGLQLYAGQVVGLSIMRELGPVLTSLMVAARVGSGIAAELGSMTVTEQVDAIQAMGADPKIKLVVPRVLAVTLVTPLLTVLADIVGVLGGMFVAMAEAGVSAQFYIDQVIRSVHVGDFTSGLSKTLFFGFFIGIIACYEGLRTTRGTEGVGLSTTSAVVVSSVTVFIADYLLTKIFLLF